MHPVFKVLIVAALLAIVAVVFRHKSQADELSGWAQYAVAEGEGLTLASLETARDQTRDTSAEPWIAYQLAIKLYDAGGRGNLDRSKQVALETLGRYPDHPSAAHLRRVVEAVDSYSGVVDKL